MSNELEINFDDAGDEQGSEIGGRALWGPPSRTNPVSSNGLARRQAEVDSMAGFGPPVLLKVIDLDAGGCFLDAGCGLGELIIEAAAHADPGSPAVGVPSAELIERARVAAGGSESNAVFEVGDITCLPFGDNTFDALRCERILQHLDENAATAAVNEFVRVAKPGGRIYVSDAVPATHAVDCQDAELFEAVVGQLKDDVRDPYAGIRLKRRLELAGATIRSWEMLVPQMDYPTWSQALGLETRLETLVATGAIETARALAFIADLAERDAAGTFTAAAFGCRALAVKP
jgi:SAM-dependent methyltransferase